MSKNAFAAVCAWDEQLDDEEMNMVMNKSKQSQVKPQRQRRSVSETIEKNIHWKDQIYFPPLPETVVIHPRSPRPQHFCEYRDRFYTGLYCKPDCDKCPKWGAKECLFGRQKASLAFCDLCPQYGTKGCIFGGSSSFSHGGTVGAAILKNSPNKQCRSPVLQNLIFFSYTISFHYMS